MVAELAETKRQAGERADENWEFRSVLKMIDMESDEDGGLGFNTLPDPFF